VEASNIICPSFYRDLRTTLMQWERQWKGKVRMDKLLRWKRNGPNRPNWIINKMGPQILSIGCVDFDKYFWIRTKISHVCSPLKPNSSQKFFFHSQTQWTLYNGCSIIWYTFLSFNLCKVTWRFCFSSKNRLTNWNFSCKINLTFSSNFNIHCYMLWVINYHHFWVHFSNFYLPNFPTLPNLTTSSVLCSMLYFQFHP